MSVPAKMRKKSKNVKLGHNTSLSTFHHIDRRDSPLSLRERISHKGSTMSCQVCIGRGTSQNVCRGSSHRFWFCSWFNGLTSHHGTIRWQISWFAKKRNPSGWTQQDRSRTPSTLVWSSRLYKFIQDVKSTLLVDPAGQKPNTLDSDLV